MTDEAPAACSHATRVDGVCITCGDCVHDVILNGACVACGATDLVITHKQLPTLIPGERLKRK
jgi:hypothetical protein